MIAWYGNQLGLERSLDAICRTWPTGRLRVADRGLREGILLNLMRDAAPARIAG